MQYSKHKELPPEETIQIIKSILDDLDLRVEESWIDSGLEDLFSVRLEIMESRVGANGKGTTRAYALASAYGEFMERLQNGVLIRGLRNTESSSKDPYECWVDSNTYSPSGELVESILAEHGFTHRSYSEIQSSIGIIQADGHEWEKRVNQWLRLAPKDRLCLLPYRDTVDGRIAYLPDFMKRVYGTNGMAAGNTVSEALVQGVSEIIERYVQLHVIVTRKSLPSFPDEWLMERYETAYRYKKRIEEWDGFEVDVLDASLGRKLPVVAVVLRNRNTQKYMVNFGCHPSLDVALERCFTELFQGRTPNDVANPFSLIESLDYDSNQMYGLLRNGLGQYPIEFFRPGEECNCDREVGCVGEDNAALLSYYEELLQCWGTRIYYRDVSYLGFPAVHIVIPGMSEVYNQGKTTIEHVSMLRRVKDWLEGDEDFGIQELKSMLAFVEYNMKTDYGSAGMNKYYRGGLDPSMDGREKECDFLVHGYLLLEDWEAAARFVDGMEERDAVKRCLRQILSGLARGMDVPAQKEVVDRFFMADIVQESIDHIEDRDYFGKRFIRNENGVAEECEYIDLLRKRLIREKEQNYAYLLHHNQEM